MWHSTLVDQAKRDLGLHLVAYILVTHAWLAIGRSPEPVTSGRPGFWPAGAPGWCCTRGNVYWRRPVTDADEKLRRHDYETDQQT
jgi:hypothetical protein